MTSIRCICENVDLRLKRNLLVKYIRKVHVVLCLFFVGGCICSTSLPGGNLVDGLPPASSFGLPGNVF